MSAMEDRPERIADYFVVVGLGESSASRFEQHGARRRRAEGRRRRGGANH